MRPLVLVAATVVTAVAAWLPLPGYNRDHDRDGSERHLGSNPGGNVQQRLSLAQYSIHDGTAGAIDDVLDALKAMQDTYFDLSVATWPAAIDWTAAVLGTQVSAALWSIVSSLTNDLPRESCAELLSAQNLIDTYFSHAFMFYFGENAFGLRNQAYDDMLWVVLGWLERLKFTEMFSHKHWRASSQASTAWYGLGINPLAAHRARIFYELASKSWDESLCGGGCIWNPYLTPYKNAITNELFASASIAMYLYWPGDQIDSPFSASFAKPRRPEHLANAIRTYSWLKESHMQRNHSGLYADGYHVTGWHMYPNGTTNPGTGQCDELDEMEYTYNQAVILTACRGLWLATGTRSYLDDGHALVDSVVRATGWPSSDKEWRGLGRDGVLEEYCDHLGQCSQDGQTFKGIFFLHLAEFCRPLEQDEQDFMVAHAQSGYDRDIYHYHLARCEAYGKWVAHNAAAALATRNDQGLFGMWWTHDDWNENTIEKIRRTTALPDGVFDHRNPAVHLALPPRISHGDFNDRGRGRTVETQSGGLAVLRALLQWQMYYT
ncbi:hypothetical protein DV735_g2131, partial [Chaetothyriales sp. CBS 134920]